MPREYYISSGFCPSIFFLYRFYTSILIYILHPHSLVIYSSTSLCFFMQCLTNFTSSFSLVLSLRVPVYTTFSSWYGHARIVSHLLRSCFQSMLVSTFLFVFSLWVTLMLSCHAYNLMYLCIVHQFLCFLFSACILGWLTAILVFHFYCVSFVDFQVLYLILLSVVVLHQDDVSYKWAMWDEIYSGQD